MATANCDVGTGKSLYFIADKWLGKLLVVHAELSDSSLTEQ